MDKLKRKFKGLSSRKNIDRKHEKHIQNTTYFVGDKESSDLNVTSAIEREPHNTQNVTEQLIAAKDTLHPAPDALEIHYRNDIHRDRLGNIERQFYYENRFSVHQQPSSSTIYDTKSDHTHIKDDSNNLISSSGKYSKEYKLSSGGLEVNRQYKDEIGSFDHGLMWENEASEAKSPGNHFDDGMLWDNAIESDRGSIDSNNSHFEEPLGGATVRLVLRPEFQPSAFLSETPAQDAAGAPIPQWKRLLVARGLAEAAQRKADAAAQEAETEARFAGMPPWKRALIEKREGR